MTQEPCSLCGVELVEESAYLAFDDSALEDAGVSCSREFLDLPREEQDALACLVILCRECLGRLGENPEQFSTVKEMREAEGQPEGSPS